MYVHVGNIVCVVITACIPAAEYFRLLLVGLFFSIHQACWNTMTCHAITHSRWSLSCKLYRWVVYFRDDDDNNCITAIMPFFLSFLGDIVSVYYFVMGCGDGCASRIFFRILGLIINTAMWKELVNRKTHLQENS